MSTSDGHGTRHTENGKTKESQGKKNTLTKGTKLDEKFYLHITETAAD